MPQADTNDVFLTGELLMDPEFREIQPSKLPVANVKLGVVERSYVNQDAARTFPVNLAFYGHYADLIRPYRLGQKLYVKGSISVRSTSKTTNSTTTEVVVHELRPIQEAPATGPQTAHGASEVEKWG